MAQRRSWLFIALILIAGAAPLRASSIPAIRGSANGIELCEQAVCGSAIFAAIFSGQAGFNPHALGTIVVSVTHTPLPDAENPDPAHLTGGVWQLQPLFGPKIAGIITGGTIEISGPGTFRVVAQMFSPATGSSTFDGTLSHNAFPPTINGTIQ